VSVDAVGLGAAAAGSVFLYAGIKGISVPAALASIVRGTSPAGLPVTTPITTPAASSSSSSSSSSTAAPAAASASYSSASAVEKLWTSNGGPADTAAFAAAIAGAESSGSATVTSSNPDGGTNVGIFQLDTLGVGSGYTVAELQDPNLNAQVTIMATNGGTDWADWGDSVAAAVDYHYTPGAPVP
jgi:hypothetical protein